MEMFLSVLVLSLVGVLVSAVLFAAAMPRPQERDSANAAESARLIRAGRFFVDDRRRDRTGLLGWVEGPVLVGDVIGVSPECPACQFIKTM